MKRLFDTFLCVPETCSVLKRPDSFELTFVDVWALGVAGTIVFVEREARPQVGLLGKPMPTRRKPKKI